MWCFTLWIDGFGGLFLFSSFSWVFDCLGWFGYVCWLLLCIWLDWFCSLNFVVLIVCLYWWFRLWFWELWLGCFVWVVFSLVTWFWCEIVGLVFWFDLLVWLFDCVFGLVFGLIFWVILWEFGFLGRFVLLIWVGVFDCLVFGFLFRVGFCFG